ncbi:PLP-dependent transferase [Gymnopus androsaceus JB14]|uniref:PLP-dependent transferase n=1 Tax=Gymnopus androsaceus JB14 TaxID=1447944 RepID=A0A6A4H5Y5_9AGAR|nr:PLP-dependent transferase [Gymnopus androsaceus JB14]
MESKPWAAMTSEEKYKTMGSWFFGPKGENHALMLKNFTSIVHNVRAGRMQYFPDDPVSITTEMIESEEFNHSAENMSLILNELTEMLGKHSVPFFSPRYAGHMSFDNSLPAVLGYLAAMQYNQNNVTPEASPFTSLIEWSVGQELCAMLGFNSTFNPAPEGEITGWGHITCGGSIANLESMWVARNLKYYPLSLKNAMKPGGPLNYIAGTFVANLCTGQQKNLFSCSTWELLNLTPTEVVDIPGRLTAQYGISDVALGKVLEPYSIQTVGKQSLDADFGITKPPQYLISLANHYSWPKGAAITGIGRENMIELPVDDDARLSIEHLRKELEKHLAEDSHSLYAVTVIVGTTEHGSVDPIDEVLELRREMQAKGLSFMVHADAAWGGYFASKKILGRARLPGGPEYAFSIPLSAYTNRQMLSLKGVDSVTLDPHKSGFNPYPAGGICYRDARFRYLTTWSSPYISVKEGADTSVGIYGVEGRSCTSWSLALPASPHSSRYADLLGVAMLTGVKGRQLSAPSVSSFRDTITNRPNYELENDPDAMALVHQLGSDLMINPFACNFHIKEGVINTDVVEASYLNRRLYQRLSITSMNDVLNDKPIVIMATEFSQERYGQALTTFKRRMGLVGNEDLYALSNVSMSPWPTAGQFLKTIVSDFKTVAEEEIKNCLVRVVVKPSFHSFVIHGTRENVYLVYMGSFNVSNYKRQMVIEGTLDGAAAHKIRAEQNKKV